MDSAPMSNEPVDSTNNPNDLGEEPMAPMEDNQTPGNQMPSDFNTNFDAGVEADEETDPKRYIQQLTGKLSQSLNSYNNENGEPDTELGKYVLGMLVKQGTKGMEEKDRKEIIKKINTSNSGDDDMTDDTNDSFDNMDQMEGDKPKTEMPMESKTFNFTKKQIVESFGIIDDVEKPTKQLDTTISSKTTRNRRTLPFEAPLKFRK
jgi:hypothetical protein